MVRITVIDVLKALNTTERQPSTMLLQRIFIARGVHHDHLKILVIVHAILASLEAAGYVESTWEDHPGRIGIRNRCFQLTLTGLQKRSELELANSTGAELIPEYV